MATTPLALLKLKQRHPDKIFDAYRDQDGLWIELTRDYFCPLMDNRTLHEDSVREILAVWRHVRPATPAEKVAYDAQWKQEA